MSETIVNEASSIQIGVAFFDFSGNAEVPNSVSYSIADAIDGTTLSTGTVSPASSVTISPSSTVNVIRHGRSFERRRINVSASFTTGQLDGECSWQVKNLGFTT